MPIPSGSQGLYWEISWQSYGSSHVGNCFSLSTSKILSLSLTFGILFMMCLSVGLFGFILSGFLCASWTCMFISLTRMEKFSVIISSNRFLIPCSVSSPSRSPMTQMLVHLMLYQRPFKLSSFFEIIFLLAVTIGCFLLPCLSNHWFDSLLHSAYCLLLLMYSSFQILH